MRLIQILWLCSGLAVVCTSRAEPPAPVVPAAQADPVAAAKKIGFTVLEYRIEGNRMLSSSSIEEVVSPYLGEDKAIADVEAARTALEKAYRDAGYLTVLVDIPEQTITSGIVRLKVAEGSVEKIRVKGSRYYDLGRILSKVPELAQDSVPYFPQVQKQMADSNRASDLRVTPVLRPGKTPGKVEVELKVEDKLPFHGSLELSNYAGPNTKPLRLSGMLRYDNLWQKEHSLSLQYQTAPEQLDQVQVLSGTYLMPLKGGDQLAMYAVSSKSNVAAVGDITLVGAGKIVGARWVMPLRTIPGLFHSFTLGVDYKVFKDELVLSGTNTGTTPVSYIPFSAGYNSSMPDEGGVTSINATINFHLRGVGDKMTDCNGDFLSQFECKRSGAKPNYLYLRGGVDRTQTLFRGTSLYAKLGGQLASGPLISNEQLVAGGADSVRGYMEGEQAGDEGIHTTLELRGKQQAEGEGNDLRVLMFVDAAHLVVKQALASQAATSNLSSVGIGLRYQTKNLFNIRMDVGWPGQSTVYTKAGEPRFGFKASMAF